MRGHLLSRRVCVLIRPRRLFIMIWSSSAFFLGSRVLPGEWNTNVAGPFFFHLLEGICMIQGEFAWTEIGPPEASIPAGIRIFRTHHHERHISIAYWSWRPHWPARKSFQRLSKPAPLLSPPLWAQQIQRKPAIRLVCLIVYSNYTYNYELVFFGSLPPFYF